MKLYIRADMNINVATGHIMRCLAIAEAAKYVGIDTTFLLADSQAEAMIRNCGYETLILHTQWDEMDQEIPVISELIHTLKIGLLVIDTYQVTADYLKALSDITKTVYIDDLNAFPYAVHMLICYASYFEDFHYSSEYEEAYRLKQIEKIPQFLAGCRYAPLRREFWHTVPKKIKKNIANILVLSGGTDQYQVSETILEQLAKGQYQRIDLVCGRYSNNLERLLSLYGKEPSIFIHTHLDNLMEYMRNADVVISAGGTTLYELCALGTPTISYSIADNQWNNVKKFHADGIIAYAGDARFDDIMSPIMDYLKQYEETRIRREKSKKMQELVDGKGALRIVKDLMENDWKG